MLGQFSNRVIQYRVIHRDQIFDLVKACPTHFEQCVHCNKRGEPTSSYK